MSDQKSTNIIPFQKRKKRFPKESFLKDVNEWGEIPIEDKTLHPTPWLSGIQRFFYAAVALLLIISFFILAFY